MSHTRMAHTRMVHTRSGSSAEFQMLAKRDAEKAMRVELDKLIETIPKTCPPNDMKDMKSDLDGFESLFKRWILETGPSVEWDKIRLPPENIILTYDNIRKSEKELEGDIGNLLDKLVVLKLNGGLGTSMGCKGPKSGISVRNDLTFLDLTVQQIESINKIYGCSIPLVLMNSFNTDEDTKKILRKYQTCGVAIYTFKQSMFPRINKESLLPVTKSLLSDRDNMEGWYPPGHGNIYDAFYNSGLLEEFINKGKSYVFMSNIDNLGANVDFNILNFLLNCRDEEHEFVMEVTDKTRADVKGGTLINYEGKLRLLEIAQVPDDYVDEFKSVNKFKIFNTNNLWIKLDAMMRIVKSKTMDLDIITNNKRLENGVKVVQLETACGAAIKNFEGAIGVNVPRSRFLPVKTTADLLLVMSDLYDMRHGILRMSDRRMFPSVPLIKLGTDFNKVADFLARFSNIPVIMELDHLTVSGDVTFGKNVILRGTVIIIANHGDRIDIPEGALLENKIVSGNLRILEH